MKLKRIKEDYYQLLMSEDPEVLHNKGGRPYVIIVKLVYRGKRQSFAVPLRSNISVSTPRYTFFSLPKRKSTKDYHVHGLHYIKLIPIDNHFLENVEMNGDYALYLEIIKRNEEKIRKEVQVILKQYEQGIKEKYSTNLDKLMEVYKEEKESLKRARKQRNKSNKI